MPEIVHPRLPRDRRIVPADRLDGWLAAGWLRADAEPEAPAAVEPTAATTDPDPAPTTKRSRPREEKE